MNRFIFPVTLTPEPEPEGGFVVTFSDVPEAITQGDDLAEALSEAADCLEEAIAGRISRKDPIPTPSTGNDFSVAVPAQTALKAALYLTMNENQITKTELARRLGVDEKEARRILDPRHGTKLPLLERALTALNKKIILTIDDAA